MLASFHVIFQLYLLLTNAHTHLLISDGLEDAEVFNRAHFEYVAHETSVRVVTASTTSCFQQHRSWNMLSTQDS